MKTAKTKSFFDAFSGHYDDSAFYSSLGTLYLSKLEESFILSNYSNVQGAKILDIGIGTGRCSSLLAKKGAKIYGIDISDEMPKKARIKLGNSLMDLNIIDVQRGIPYPYSSFDTILCIRVLKYMPNWKFVINEISRVLKPGGFLILEISAKNSIALLAEKRSNYFLFNPKEVITILEKNNFLIRNISGGTKLPFILYKNIHSHPLLDFAKSIEKLLQVFLSFHFSRNILILAEKVE
jgi:ubiquinone/menaquinone biosynthesis C-methylase UbiE